MIDKRQKTRFIVFLSLIMLGSNKKTKRWRRHFSSTYVIVNKRILQTDFFLNLVSYISTQSGVDKRNSTRACVNHINETTSLTNFLHSRHHFLLNNAQLILLSFLQSCLYLPMFLFLLCFYPVQDRYKQKVM